MDKSYDINPVRTSRRSSKRKIRILLGLLITLVILAISNPTREDFVDYGMNRPDELFNTGESGVITNIIAKSLLDSFTGRENYILFSVFSIPKVKDNNHFIGDIQEKKKYLGLFKIIFIEL